MEHVWCENGFDGVANCVSEVDKVTESGLAFIDGDDVRFDVDAASDDREEERLRSRARAEVTTCIAGGRRANSIVDQLSVSFKGSKFRFIPYRRGLWWHINLHKRT